MLSEHPVVLTLLLTLIPIEIRLLTAMSAKHAECKSSKPSGQEFQMVTTGDQTMIISYVSRSILFLRFTRITSYRFATYVIRMRRKPKTSFDIRMGQIV